MKFAEAGATTTCLHKEQEDLGREDFLIMQRSFTHGLIVRHHSALSGSNKPVPLREGGGGFSDKHVCQRLDVPLIGMTERLCSSGTGACQRSTRLPTQPLCFYPSGYIMTLLHNSGPVHVETHTDTDLGKWQDACIGPGSASEDASAPSPVRSLLLQLQSNK